MSINTTLNYTVVFYCEATADELSFRVNNLPADDVVQHELVLEL